MRIRLSITFVRLWKIEILRIEFISVMCEWMGYFGCVCVFFVFCFCCTILQNAKYYKPRIWTQAERTLWLPSLCQTVLTWFGTQLRFGHCYVQFSLYIHAVFARFDLSK